MALIEYSVRIQNIIEVEKEIEEYVIQGDLTIIDKVSVYVDETWSEDDIYANFNELDHSVPDTAYQPSDELAKQLQQWSDKDLTRFFDDVYDMSDYEIIDIEMVE